MQVFAGVNCKCLPCNHGGFIGGKEEHGIADVIRQSYPEQEIEVQEGGQPHYFFIIAVE